MISWTLVISCINGNSLICFTVLTSAWFIFSQPYGNTLLHCHRICLWLTSGTKARAEVSQNNTTSFLPKGVLEGKLRLGFLGSQKCERSNKASLSAGSSDWVSLQDARNRRWNMLLSQLFFSLSLSCKLMVWGCATGVWNEIKIRKWVHHGTINLFFVDLKGSFRQSLPVFAENTICSIRTIIHREIYSTRSTHPLFQRVASSKSKKTKQPSPLAFTPTAVLSCQLA